MTGLTRPTVDNVMRGMVERDVRREMTGYARNRIYSLYRYDEIFANEENVNA